MLKPAGGGAKQGGGGGTGSSVPQFASQLRGGDRVCKAANDGRGCSGAKLGKKCGAGWHVCDVVVPGAGPCVATDHLRDGHSAANSKTGWKGAKQGRKR